jgi:3-deoxy-7-phosphoheptulonate synthase
MPERWTRDSWRQKKIAQVPEYPDKAALDKIEREIATFPPLVFAGEARNLKQALGRVAMGEGFRHGRGFPAARRRLCRKLLGAERQ